MNNLLKDSLAVGFFIALMLFFANIWAVKSDQQSEAQHQQVTKWKMENKGASHEN